MVGILPAHSGLYFSVRIVVRGLIFGMAVYSHEVSGVAAQELHARSLRQRIVGINDTEFTHRRRASSIYNTEKIGTPIFVS